MVEATLGIWYWIIDLIESAIPFIDIGSFG